MNEGYWQKIMLEINSSPDYRAVVDEYCEKYNLKELPKPEDHENDPTAGYVYFKHETIKDSKTFYDKGISEINPDSIVRILKKGGHLAPEQVEAKGLQENPPEMEAAQPIKPQKIKLPKIGETIQ